MSLKGQTIKTAPFPEFVAVTSALAKNPSFDIIIDQENTLDNYCFALLEKTFTLRQSQIPAFVNYQKTLVKDPITWLNKFEKLLANNEELFSSKRAMSRFNKLYNLIELSRKELQSSSVKETTSKTPKRLINAESEERYFSFWEVKKHVESLQSYSEKVIYLTDEICEYKQSEVYFVNNKLLDYKKQCKALLKRIQEKKILKNQLEKEQQEEFSRLNLEIKSNFKIRLNGPLNILTDAYKQMMYGVKPNGTPYMQHKIKEIAKFICDNHLDENGNELSMQTVLTYLSPTRADKNPNIEWKIKL